MTKLILNKKANEIIGDTFLSGLSKDDFDKKIAEAYLGVLTNDRTLFNPLGQITPLINDNFPQYVLHLMSQPEYFYFIIKYIFQMDSFPQQCMMLRELYNHKFPLLIGSRGVGKAHTLETPILTDNGWSTMGDMNIGTKIYSRDGKLYNVTAIHPQGKKQVWRVFFVDGRTVDCCEDHLWTVKRQKKEVVLSTKKMYTDGLISRGPSGKHAYKFKVPLPEPIELSKNELSMDPYILGCMLGDGCMTTATPKIASDDIFIIDQFREKLKGFKIEKDPTNNNYTIVDIDKQVNERCRLGTKHFRKDGNRFTDLIRSLSLNVGCLGKFIPNEYKTSSIEDRMELVRGLLDTDGSINKNGSIEFTNTNETLINDLMDVLRSLGITCRKSIDDRTGQQHILPNGKIGIRGTYFRIFINTSKKVFKLPRKLSRLKIKRTDRESYNPIIKIEPITEYKEMQCISVDSPDHTYITKDYVVTHNSIGLAMYMMIKMILLPGSKCIITSAGFRQSKVVFDYMETIWKKSLVLQSCFKGGKNGPTHGTDVWTFRLGDSITYALPVGPDGSKVRGYRANCVHSTTLIQTDKGLIKIKDFKTKSCESVININRELEEPKTHYNTEEIDVYELTTENGYKLRFSEIHQLNGPTGWIIGTDLTYKDVYLDNNEYFPQEYCKHSSLKLDEESIFLSGLLNLSTLGADEIPWYILQSPRKIVYKFLNILFGQYWINKKYNASSRYKLEQLQILLLKFNFIANIKEVGTKFELTVLKQHLEPETRPVEKVISVVKLDKQESLYDFELMETNSFSGGGFINHNCLVTDEFSCTRKSLVATDIGLLKIEDIVENKIKCNVYNINGELEPIIGWVKTPVTDVYNLTTKYGYEIEFSDKHKFMLSTGEWKKGIDLTKDDFILFDNNYKFPLSELKSYKNIPSNDLAYLYGLLISEGYVCNKNFVSIINTDKELIDDLQNRFSLLNPKVYIKKALTDKRGWNCKESYEIRFYSVEFREFLFSQGIEYKTAINKVIPWSILQCSRENVLNFLKGAFIGDGSAFIWKDRGNKKIGVAYYSSSKLLVDQMQILLKSLGYLSYKNKRDSSISKNKQWFIRLNGTYASDFITDIQYPNLNKLISEITPFVDRLRNKTGTVYYRKKYNNYSVHSYKNCKSIYLGLVKTKDEGYLKIKNFNDKTKLCVQVKSVKKINERSHLYDISLPNTHSYYANGLVSHNSINRQVFEEVMSGFLSVASSPVEQIKFNAKKNTMKMFNIPIPKSDQGDGDFMQNQLILSGTAYYQMNHFYAYFNKWHDIIMSKQNPKLLKDMFTKDEDAKHINPDDYSIIRIPIELTTSGYMDMAQISRIKASTTKDVYLREYCAVFTNDSDGFFRISLIDSCTCQEGDPEIFPPALYGNRKKKYVFGVDPAYEGDNFAVVVIELNGNHRRVVHVWTTQASDHKARLLRKIITENDYYHYCVRKIRDLMKRFPCEYIAIDSQGGGKAVMEAFTDITKLKEGESIILPTIEIEEKIKETDVMSGLHIIKIVNFTSEWIATANYALKKDMEDKTIRFPFSDDVSYAIAEYYDESLGKNKELYDTLDDCIFEIEELKKELTTITVSETATGREKFDTPSVKVGINKKGRLKKDRYSALLMANIVSREIDNDGDRLENPDLLDLSSFCTRVDTGVLFKGNSKIASQLNKLYGGL